jgi:hypothetical protein
MCKHKEGYFGLSEEELEENPQFRAFADDGVVSEDGWDKRKQAEDECWRFALKEHTNYQPSPYDFSK